MLRTEILLVIPFIPLRHIAFRCRIHRTVLHLQRLVAASILLPVRLLIPSLHHPRRFLCSNCRRLSLLSGKSAMSANISAVEENESAGVVRVVFVAVALSTPH